MKKITSLVTSFMMFFGMNVMAQLPAGVEVSTPEAKHYYYIKSMKKANRTLYVMGAESQSGRLITDNHAANAIWYVEQGTDGKYLLKNYGRPDLNVFENAMLSDKKVTQFTFGESEHGKGNSYISYTNENNEVKGWNDSQGYGYQIAGYDKLNDDGNAFSFVSVETLPTFLKAADVKSSENGNVYVYSIRSARSGKFLSYNGVNALQQNNTFDDYCYFYFVKKGDNYIVKNLASDVASMSVNGESLVCFSDGEGVEWSISDCPKMQGAVYIKNGNNFMNERGGCNNDDNGDVCSYSLADAGDEWILKEEALPAITVPEVWNNASTGVEKNGIMYSSYEGVKYYYSLESHRQNVGARYASSTGFGNIVRTVAPNSESNKWYFLRHQDDPEAVVLVNAADDHFLLSQKGNMSPFRYGKFYLVNSRYEGYTCITVDKNKINEGTNCLDASQDNNATSTGWRDNDGDGCAWAVNPIEETPALAMAPIAVSGVYGTTKTYISTFSSPFNVELPSAVEAYIVSAKSETSASLTKIEGNQVPANTGVILLGDDATYNYTNVFASVVAAVDGNLLKASSNNDPIKMAANDYVLANSVDGTMFYKAKENSVLAEGKAYLHFDNVQANSMVLNFGGEATGIEGVEAENANAPIYDLSGRRVNNTVKGGIYIQNGKKFIVK